MKTNVLVRTESQSVDVDITSQAKPEVDKIVLEKWQRIIDIVAEILEVPAALIMRITKDYLNVMVKSENEENPFTLNTDVKLGTGIFCENVIGTDQELIIEDARRLTVWKDALPEDYGMVSYFGLPIHWPDHTFFGTICVFDNKEHRYTERFIRLMESFQGAMEDDLKLLTNQQHLHFLANKDLLTHCYNREAITRKLQMELSRSIRSKVYFSLIFVDVNYFSLVNEKYGYKTGDKVLKHLSDILESQIRSIDMLGRWAGDEFIVICPSTNSGGANKAIEKLSKKISEDPYLRQYQVSCSFGYSTYRSNKDTVDYLILEAERKLQEYKTVNK